MPKGQFAMAFAVSGLWSIEVMRFYKSAVILVCLWGSWMAYQSTNTTVHVMGMEPLSMPRRDKRVLEKFFRNLVIKDPFAFTLVGSKPLSIDSFTDSLLPPESTQRNGWKVWKKYRQVFDNPNIGFWEEESAVRHGCTMLILANKEKVLECLQKHQEDFSRTVHRDMNELSFLEQRPFLSSALRDEHFLIGILLGFGRGNAACFQDRLSQDLPPAPSVWAEEVVMPMIRRQIYAFWSLRSYSIDDILPPLFVGDPDSEESQALKGEYWDMREKIIRYYQGKDFLEATLALYMHGRTVL